MADTIQVDVCRTPEGGKQTNVATVCLWCQCNLKELLKEGKFKAGASGDDAKKLHAHLTRFGMQVELGTEKDGKPQESTEVKNGTWGAETTRALRMFALHPQVASEPAHVLKSDGKSITADLVTKIQEWCRGNVTSPKHYWEVKGLQIKEGDLDAIGASATPEKQTVLHDYIAQIETDLAKTGFAVHSDSLCGLGATHKPKGKFQAVKANAAGEHEDKSLSDIPYLVGKFQRQAQWLWRMKADGTHLADAKAADASVYAGACNGEVDAATAKALHAWVEAGLHAVMNKFELKGLNWPPVGGAQIVNQPAGTQAKLRKDVYEDWLKAAQEVEKQGATLAGPYSSCPRGWKSGKSKEASASSWSFHLCAVAVDICQDLLSSDGSISDKKPYGLEKDGDRFKIWCWLSPQPPKPADPADDTKDATKKYRNRNIRYKHVKGAPNGKVKASEPSDTSPLYFATTTKTPGGGDVVDVAAKEGWYINISEVMEANKLARIPRHKNWDKDPKAWEWWHYQCPPHTPTGSSSALSFGECLQLYGVHEYRLRQLANGWSTHEDIEHAPG